MSTTSSSSHLPTDGMAEVRRARAYLARVAEPPAPALSAFIDAHGPVEAARRVQVQQVPESVARETALGHRLDLIDADFAAAAEIGARLIIPEDEEEWPTHLITALAKAATTGASWAIPPVALWVRSAVPLRDALDNAVSVVGARSATGYGEFVAAEIGVRLAKAETTVVSGAAYGIDGAAHRGALAAEGLTVAILACGVDLPYPRGHATLIDQIAASGLVLSEYPPGMAPAKHRFVVRNRLIAALSRGTVVVEAGARSGALSTAHRARVLGRRVLAVPGPITSAQSTGCHQLIRDHAAELVTSVADIHHALDTTRPRQA